MLPTFDSSKKLLIIVILHSLAAKIIRVRESTKLSSTNLNLLEFEGSGSRGTNKSESQNFAAKASAITSTIEEPILVKPNLTFYACIFALQ